MQKSQPRRILSALSFQRRDNVALHVLNRSIEGDGIFPGHSVCSFDLFIICLSKFTKHYMEPDICVMRIHISSV